MNVLKPIFSILIIALLTSCHASKEEVKPNVVFFLVDDLGWTDLACYGSDFYQTPNVDQLAKSGVRFTNGYASCTVCSPTRASIMSGKYPATINCTDWIKGWNFSKAKLKVPEWTMHLDTAEYTLAEAFSDAGYLTAHFGKWHLGEDVLYWPENQGFDVNVGGWSNGSPRRNKKHGYKGYFAPFGNPRMEDKPGDYYLTERLADEAVTFIDKNKDKPFFLNFWFYNVHTPLMATPEKIDKYKALVDTAKAQQNPIYAAMVEHMDDAVGMVMDKLEAEGLLDNTIIVFTSDNGGLTNGDNSITNNAPLQKGKGHMYEGGVRVPNIMVVPKVTTPGRIIETPMISMDYYPTLAELAGISLPAEVQDKLEGKSLVSLLSGAQDFDRDAIYWHYPHYHKQGARPYSAIRMGDWKLIRFLEDDRYELYNLKEDISESENLCVQHPDVYKQLKQKLFDWYQKVDAQMPLLNPKYDVEKAHGYSY